MKRIITAIAFALSTTVTFAVELPCESIASTARTVMDARQSGVALSKVLAIVDQYPDTKTLMRQIVLDAYSKPRYSSEEFRLRETEEFGNTWEIACHKANSAPSKKGASNV
jgi:hypothetical protein